MRKLATASEVLKKEMQRKIYDRVLTEKIFPMQATVLTVDAFIAEQE